MNKENVLKKYFGYDSFKEGQSELIDNVMKGRDILGIMPTGAGKSICYQVPALLMDGITIVISPLISLMQDQVMSLKQSGVAGAYINSSLTPRQVSLALQYAREGRYKLIYVAPERLLTNEFLSFAVDANISMIAVDEAHCISQWGQDFRPSYTDIPTFLTQIQSNPVVTAFTATATSKVKEDIIRLLKLRDPFTLVTGFDRENLYFEVLKPKNKMSFVNQYVKERKNQSGIIYCSTRKNVDEVYEFLIDNGYNATKYHAGLSDIDRKENQENFIRDITPIVVATNAFGMGIDKSNVSYVLHYNMPKDIESYYQEAGRAGRDGSQARCTLLYSPQDVRTIKWLIENANQDSEIDLRILKEIEKREYERLKQMTFYCTINTCLRRFILKYFGEVPKRSCGYCGNCNTNYEEIDVLEESKKIISCIKSLRMNFGMTMIIDILRGSKNARLLELGFDSLESYATSKKSLSQLKEIIDFLIKNEYISQEIGKFSTLDLNDNSNTLLNRQEPLMMTIVKKESIVVKSISQSSAEDKEVFVGRSKAKSGKKSKVPIENQELFDKLKELRMQIAVEQSVPAFVVFTDMTLISMIKVMPRNEDEFLNVIGVGEAKLEKYGRQFLQVIGEFL